ncbi:hypothetical protein D3C75_669260 [compost metagenome]
MLPVGAQLCCHSCRKIGLQCTGDSCLGSDRRVQLHVECRVFDTRCQMVSLTCTKLVQRQRRMAGIEVAAVMTQRFCTLQMNQLGNFMRIVIAGKIQNISVF